MSRNFARDTVKGALLEQGAVGAYGVGFVNAGATVTKNDTIVIGNDTYEFFDDVAITEGNIQVTVTGDLTAAAWTDALIAAINANANSIVEAVDISTSLILLVSKRIGETVTLDDSGFTSGSNTVDAMAHTAEATLAKIGKFTIVPTAAEVTKGEIVIAPDFAPWGVQVFVTTTADGTIVAWDGAIVIDPANGLVTIDNSGAVDWAATDTVTILVY